MGGHWEGGTFFIGGAAPLAHRRTAPAGLKGHGSEWSLVPNPNSNSNRSHSHNANVTLRTCDPSH